MPSKPSERQLLQYLGTLELQIMRAVWAMGPSTVNDVLDRLNRRKGRDLVYNTVMSTMARLSDKGYLDRHREGKAYVYEATDPEQFLQERVADSVREAYAEYGDLALAGFRDGLDPTARAALQRLLSEDQ